MSDLLMDVGFAEPGRSDCQEWLRLRFPRTQIEFPPTLAYQARGHRFLWGQLLRKRSSPMYKGQLSTLEVPLVHSWAEGTHFLTDHTSMTSVAYRNARSGTKKSVSVFPAIPCVPTLRWGNVSPRRIELSVMYRTSPS